MKVSFAHESSPMVGEIENGDRAVARTDDAGRTLLAVVDGLGHGPEAAAVAKNAAELLTAASLELPVLDLMQNVHARLHGSRGAAATLCLVRGREVEVCAVGNVELRSSDVRVPLVFSAGIVGIRVQKFHVCRAKVPTRARIVLFSDGLSSRTPVDDFRGLGPTAACAAMMQKYRRKEDDATVLVADLE